MGAIIMLTARIFVDYSIAHPAMMILFLVLTTVPITLPPIIRTPD